MNWKMSLLGFLVLVFIGCSSTSGQVMVTGTARTPTNPEQVKIYYAPPTSYETIGVVSVQINPFGIPAPTQMDVFKEMQKQAATIGANGVLVATGTGWIHTGEAIFVTRE
jgi:hypothetical protein